MDYKIYNLNDGTEVKIPIATCYGDCFTLAQSDIFRVSGKKESKLKVIYRMLFKPLSSALIWFRFCQYRGLLFLYFRIMYRICQLVYNIDIPTKTKVGYGFYIGHGMCIVINSGTIIGNNVNISQFTNIGTNNETPAIIGDNVWLGPTVCVVENVNIHTNASVGAGAVVIKDVPANGTVAGVPAKILNFDNPGRFIKNRWVND